MKEVFGYIVGLGAPVMMHIIFTVLGVCIGIKFGKALKAVCLSVLVSSVYRSLRLC